MKRRLGHLASSSAMIAVYAVKGQFVNAGRSLAKNGNSFLRF
jgi:hypothetical protein